MFWPLVDAMPLEPTASDRAFLARAAQVIQMAHSTFGMKFWITLCPNVVGNAHAAEYSYTDRPYFICERKINPADKDEMVVLLAARRWQLEPLREADGLVIIDGDPGGYIGSTDEQFVDLLAGQIGIFRQFNPTAELVYWTWFGWENYNRFWQEAQRLTGSSAEPQYCIETPTFTRALTGIIERIPEPWSVMGAWPQHLEATQALGLESRRLYIPYGAIEGEPSFPLTNFTPAQLCEAFDRYPAGTFPRGVMANAQAHCLQLPHTYLFSRYAREGTSCAVDMTGFAAGLLPGFEEQVSAAWEAIGSHAPARQREAARVIRMGIGRRFAAAEYSGMIFGSSDRFLLDLAENLEVRASLADLGVAVSSSDPGARRAAVREVLTHLQPYQQRLGFVDAYGGPLDELLNQPLSCLGDAGLDAVLNQFHDWRNPSVRNGVVSRLLVAMQVYCQD
jgi:hypothetical protein